MKKQLFSFVLILLCVHKAHMLTSVEVEILSNPINSNPDKEKLNNNLKSKLRVDSKTSTVKDDKPTPPTSNTSVPSGSIISNLNALGQEVNINVYVETPPYSIERCDQIISFETEYVKDLDDYTDRAKAHATITAYHINISESKDPSKLIQSNLLTNSRIPFSEPLGAENCLMIDGGESEKSLIVCAQDKNELSNYKSVLTTFEDCRKGKIIMKPGLSNNEVALASTNNEAAGSQASNTSNLKKCISGGPQLLKKNKAPENSEEFWVPGGQKVPGSKD